MDNKEEFDRTKREMVRDYFTLRDKIRLQDVCINKQRECFLDTATSKDKVIGMEASITKERGLVISKVFERTEEPKFGSGVHDLLKNQGIYDYELQDDGSILIEPVIPINVITLGEPMQCKEGEETIFESLDRGCTWYKKETDNKLAVDYMQITRDIANT